MERFLLTRKRTESILLAMKNKKRSTTRLTEEAFRKLQKIRGALLMQHGAQVTNDDIIDRLVMDSDAKAVVAAFAAAAEARA